MWCLAVCAGSVGSRSPPLDDLGDSFSALNFTIPTFLFIKERTFIHEGNILERLLLSVYFFK